MSYTLRYDSFYPGSHSPFVSFLNDLLVVRQPDAVEEH